MKTLVILAAGMGSRYSKDGSLKQLATVDTENHILIHYSIYEAVKAGFNQLIFIIREEMEDQFKECIGTDTWSWLYSQGVVINFAFQDVKNVFDAYRFSDRIKPWGTVHALLCAEQFIHFPFFVINADDYYDSECFQKASSLLDKPETLPNGALIAYRLHKTLSPNGRVNRGICSIDGWNNLDKITEIHSIHAIGIDSIGHIRYEHADEGYFGELLTNNTLVSMNTWVLPNSILDAMRFAFHWFRYNMVNPNSDEYILSDFMSDYLQGYSGKYKKKIPVFPVTSPWLGITVPDDLAWVRNELSLVTNVTLPF